MATYQTCSPLVTVTAGAQPTTCSGTPVMSIAASPNRVHVGDATNLTWTASNVPGASPSCKVTRSDNATPITTVAAGAYPTCKIPDGSSQQTVTTQTVFTLDCGGVATSTIVNVIPGFTEF